MLIRRTINGALRYYKIKDGQVHWTNDESDADDIFVENALPIVKELRQAGIDAVAVRI